MNDDHRTTWERYVSAWKEVAREGKLAALGDSVDPACKYRDPLTAADGHEALTDYMLGFHQQVPGGHFETVYFASHHDRSVARWNMRNGDNVVLSEGISYGEYDQRGKLVAMTGFFDVPPPPTAD